MSPACSVYPRRAHDNQGQVALVAREGDLLEVAAGDFRTITFVNLIIGSGGQDGGPSGLNDDGELGFLASFADGSSGAFVASPCSAADLNGDCVVNSTDFMIFLAAWGSCPEPPAPCQADLDGNGVVNAIDFFMLMAAWG